MVTTGRRRFLIRVLLAGAVALAGCDEPSERGIGGAPFDAGGGEVVLVANGLGESFSALVRGEGVRNNWGRTGAAPNAMALRGDAYRIDAPRWLCYNWLPYQGQFHHPQQEACSNDDANCDTRVGPRRGILPDIPRSIRPQ